MFNKNFSTLKKIINYFILQPIKKILILLLLTQRRNSYCFLFNIYSFLLKSNVKIYFKNNFYYIKNFHIRFSEEKIGELSYLRGIDNRIADLRNSYLISELNFQDEDVIIDCGAQNGDFYLCFNQKVKYYGIEPSPKIFSNLQYNVKNQNLINKAVWSSKENANFYLKDDYSDSSIIEIKDYEKIITIQTITLDELIDEINNKIIEIRKKKIKLIKIDAEGGEPEVLLGLCKNLVNVQYITIDCGFERGAEKKSTLPECANYLLKNNFHIVNFTLPRYVILFKNNNYESNKILKHN